MISVFVWLPRQANNQKNVGHASMLINGSTYVSWWPDQAAGLGRDFHPIRNKSYISDVKDEGGAPNKKIDLLGLNESAVVDWWSGFSLTRGNESIHGPMRPYNLLNQNCSTIVATGLKEGGGNNYASWFSSWSVVWRPQTVLDYAVAIQNGLMQKR